MTARDIGKTAPRGREAPLLDLALVSNSGISLPYPRYIRKATALACPSQVRATSPVKRPRLWDSEVRAPVALICQYIDRHKERFEAWPICRVLSDSGTKIAPATALHHTTGHYPPGRSRDHPRSRGVYRPRPARTTGQPDHPRSRGVYACLGSELAPVVRIIPARARFTCGAVNFGLHATDHPRSRGVYQALDVMTDTAVGSSPLARGLPEVIVGRIGAAGIIPARAGFTQDWRRRARRRRDHPRSRGVYQPEETEAAYASGSSPLARGLPGPEPGERHQEGIIPARAGFTVTHLGRRVCPPDHPRSRGVYFGVASVETRGDGIIPARAGFTRAVLCAW